MLFKSGYFVTVWQQLERTLRRLRASSSVWDLGLEALGNFLTARSGGGGYEGRSVLSY
jgi:hypothetical protein